jgi:hypothetical protein
VISNFFLDFLSVKKQKTGTVHIDQPKVLIQWKTASLAGTVTAASDTVQLEQASVPSSIML